MAVGAFTLAAAPPKTARNTASIIASRFARVVLRPHQIGHVVVEFGGAFQEVREVGVLESEPRSASHRACRGDVALRELVADTT
jgi:hypothetical protein